MRLQKNGIVYDLTDKVQIDAFIGIGWAVVEPEHIPETPDFEAMTIEEMKQYATEHGIDISTAKLKPDYVAILIEATERGSK